MQGIYLVQVALKHHPVDPPEHALISRRLCEATGRRPKELNLPPPVNVEAARDHARRRKAFESGSPDFIDPDDGNDTAARFVGNWQELARYGGDFYVWKTTHYEPIFEEEVIARIYQWLATKRDVTRGEPIKPDRALVEATLHAVRSAALIAVLTVPGWIGDARGRPDASVLAPFENCLLDVETRERLKPTMAFFTLNAREYVYHERAKRPVHWPEFLAGVFGDDVEAIETLQEIFGLLLTADTSFQKAFLIVGPPRSGKGTILRILRAIVGPANVAAPTLAGLGGPFGMQSLIGKLAALISDARLGGRADIQAISENLLRITGEDAVSVPRKHREDWTAKLTSRFVIVSNELPAFLDQSGALSSRFIVLQLKRSFLGREDLGLTDRLLSELSGIALWALDGLDRLRDRGYFRQPASALESVRQLETLASPMKAFLAERCEIAPGATVECSTLYSAWCAWAQEQGRDRPGTLQIFGRNLSAALPDVRITQPRINGRRERRYEGIRLADVERAGTRTDPLSFQSEFGDFGNE